MIDCSLQKQEIDKQEMHSIEREIEGLCVFFFFFNFKATCM